MAKIPNGIIISKCLTLAILALLVSAPVFADTLIGWGGVGFDDFTTWGQLGADGTLIPNPKGATSAGLNPITISFAGVLTGQTAVQCPALPSCAWSGVNPGFAAGDTLIWADNGTGGSLGTGTGPLTLSFGNLVSAAGLYLQSVDLGQFTATVLVTLADASTHSIAPITSDVTGDPVFIGMQDTTAANIKKITFDVSASSLGDVHDFAVDTLYTMTSGGAAPVPEPQAWLLLLVVAGFTVFRLRRRTVS